MENATRFIKEEKGMCSVLTMVIVSTTWSENLGRVGIALLVNTK